MLFIDIGFFTLLFLAWLVRHTLNSYTGEIRKQRQPKEATYTSDFAEITLKGDKQHDKTVLEIHQREMEYRETQLQYNTYLELQKIRLQHNDQIFEASLLTITIIFYIACRQKIKSWKTNK